MKKQLRFYLLILSSAMNLLAQSSVPAPGQVPLPALYEGLIRNLAAVSRQSDALDSAGNKSHKLKQGVCDTLAVGSSDCSLIFRIAVATAAQLEALDQQAQAIINGIRSQHPHKPQADGTVLPAPPPELSHLQTQRDSVVKVAAGALQQQLTAGGAAALGNYLTAHH